MFSRLVCVLWRVGYRLTPEFSGFVVGAAVPINGRTSLMMLDLPISGSGHGFSAVRIVGIGRSTWGNLSKFSERSEIGQQCAQ